MSCTKLPYTLYDGYCTESWVQLRSIITQYQAGTMNPRLFLIMSIDGDENDLSHHTEAMQIHDVGISR